MVVASLGIGVATYIAFVIIAIVVLVLAGYLIAVAYVLSKVSRTLGKVIAGVDAIKDQTTPVEYVLAGIASDVGAIQGALRGLLPKEKPPPPKAVRRSMPRRPVSRVRP
ncbi:MAG: DUF948 domain-containing protein [Actinomycetota bacterium]|nr:DUF948 domain-containing protein [Actinomycetota bacterium]